MAAGVRYLQIDEPAFVTRYDQPEELDVAIEAMHRICSDIPEHVTVFTHMCYGAFHEVYPKMLELPAHVYSAWSLRTSRPICSTSCAGTRSLPTGVWAMASWMRKTPV